MLSFFFCWNSDFTEFITFHRQCVVGWCFAALKRQISKMQKIFGFWRDPFFQWSRSSSFQNVSSSSGFGFYYDMIYLLTAVGLTPDGCGTVHIYTQTIHRTTQLTTIDRPTQLTTNWEECGLCWHNESSSTWSLSSPTLFKIYINEIIVKWNQIYTKGKSHRKNKQDAVV